jgi:hypothetical protein
MQTLCMGILLMVVLVVDTCLTLRPLDLTFRHGSAVGNTHVGRKASRQLCSELEFIGVGQDRLLLTGRGIEGVVPSITSALTGRAKGLHIGRVDLSRILTARHGSGRAGFLQDGRLSVLILKER